MHWTQRRQRAEAYARAKRNGFYKPEPQAEQEQTTNSELLALVRRAIAEPNEAKARELIAQVNAEHARRGQLVTS